MANTEDAKERQRIRLERRNEKIRRRFENLSGQKKGGRRIYTNEYIIHRIADEFYLAERTIESILFENKK